MSLFSFTQLPLQQLKPKPHAGKHMPPPLLVLDVEDAEADTLDVTEVVVVP
jgi:hypothetical protein